MAAEEEELNTNNMVNLIQSASEEIGKKFEEMYNSKDKEVLDLFSPQSTFGFIMHSSDNNSGENN